MNVMYNILEFLNRINEDLEAKFEAQKKRYDELAEEFEELFHRGLAGELKLPNYPLLRFSKATSVKKLEKLNRKIKKMNGL